MLGARRQTRGVAVCVCYVALLYGVAMRQVITAGDPRYLPRVPACVLHGGRVKTRYKKKKCVKRKSTVASFKSPPPRERLLIPRARVHRVRNYIGENKTDAPTCVHRKLEPLLVL